MRLMLTLLLCVVCESAYSYYQNFTVSLDHSPLSKIAINDADGILYVGGKNIFVQLNFDLQEIQRQIIGPVNNSKNCKPFGTACLYRDFVTTDNYISILKLYKASFLIVCGTAHQGLCFKYNPLNITENFHFADTYDRNRDNLYRNFLGSSNSSVMYITKSNEGSDMFYVGQSYDGRNLDYFYKEFAAIDLYTQELRFDHFAAQSFQSICPSKKNNFRIKFLHIFESDGYIFYVFIRSANIPGSFEAYDTRISRLCKSQTSYKSYEEMTISCKSATITYNIGLSANFSNKNLYMSFGIGYQSRNFEVDNTQGSAVCVYNITQIKQSFDRDVLSECFRGTLHSPTWQCEQTACPEKVSDIRSSALTVTFVFRPF